MDENEHKINLALQLFQNREVLIIDRVGSRLFGVGNAELAFRPWP